MHDPLIQGVDSPAMRRAGRDLLSVALMDARNHTLHLIGQLVPALESAGLAMPLGGEHDPPLWTLGHIGWFQERWVARNVHRNQGRGADPTASRLPSVEPQADHWWDDAQVPQEKRGALSLPSLEQTRAYLMETLETTLELLEKAPDTDPALYFFRLALCHEDMRGESLIELAQSLGCPLDIALPGAMALRPPLLVPAARWMLGSAPESGFSFDNERPAHAVDVPEFEIDAQPVSWAQYVEFVDDGGYDRSELWLPAGWEWLQSQSAGQGGRAPRYVEQIGVASGAVMQTRFGSPRRMLGGQPVMHVSWWEADAWCRWAGRRLPAEVEWELAAHTAARRGFRWGTVWEWTGSTARPYPDFAPDPWRSYSQPCFGSHKVLRGASFATRERMKQPRFRNFQRPQSDQLFAGFRSCAA
jgi:ergothioneine biosynthesis protein EgtB